MCYGLIHWSYNVGTSAIEKLTRHSKEFTRAASILGVIVVGALVSLYGETQFDLEIPNGESPIVIQEILDGIMPKLLPLGLTLFLFWLLLGLGLLGALIGIF